MVRWYYARDNKQKHGPFSASQLKQLAGSGLLLPTDMVVREGSGSWAAAASVKGLFDAVDSAAIKSAAPTARPKPRPVKTAAPPRRTLRWMLVLFWFATIVGPAGYFAWQGEELGHQLATVKHDLEAEQALAARKSPEQSTEPPATPRDLDSSAEGKIEEAVAAALKNHELAIESATRKYEQASKQVQLLEAELAAAKRQAKKDDASLRTWSESHEKLKSDLTAAEKEAKEAKDTAAGLRKQFAELEKKSPDRAALKRLVLLSSESLATYALDQYALHAPPEAEATLPALAAYLTEPARNDRDRVRAIYRWITDRIAYDVDSFLANKPGAFLPEDVLKSRLCVCAGYARLFDDLCRRTGVESAVIQGHVNVEAAPLGENHAWNAVKLDGKWELIDSTWGAGYVEARRFVKSNNDVYFLTRPDELIFTHLPTDEKWQLLETPVSAAEFEKLKKVGKDVTQFEGMSLEFRRRLDDGSFRGFVKLYSIPSLELLIRKAPVERHLQAGVSYAFKIEAPTLSAAALRNGDKWTFMKRNGAVFEGRIQPNAGPLVVCGQLPEKGQTYWSLMEYEVEKAAASGR